MAELDVSHLTKSYGSHKVLDGLSLEVEKGSFTSVLGPSGSGKTTLLRIIAGFERADAGTVRMGDSVVNDRDVHVPPERRRIGYVPQEGSLFPHLTVEANVAFGLDRRRRRQGKAADLIEMVGLGSLERRYPHQLSGGQQQRVALARALAVRPSLVLLDEPFSSLDAGLRAAVRQDVRQALRDAGATVVLVTHDQDEALSQSDKVAVVEAGRIAQYGTPTELYRRPSTPALAKALGQANFLPGTSRGDHVETALGQLALEGAAHPDGVALLVMVRPEQLDVRPGHQGGTATAVVTGTEYLGHGSVVRLRADFLPGEALVARTGSGRPHLAPGSPVSVAVKGPVVTWAFAPPEDGAGER